MRTYNLSCELLARQSIGEVFRIFEDPYNLAKITPPALGFKIVTKGLEMKRGLTIEYRIKMMGIPLAWKSLITEYEPPFLFVDEQITGPYQYWHHTHRFRPAQEGTVVSDSVDYRLPFDPFSRVANAILVRRQLLAIFNYRQKALEGILGGTTQVRVEPTIVVKEP